MCQARCTSRAPRRPWSWGVAAGGRQHARGSAVSGPCSNPAGLGRQRPRDWGSGAPPSSLLLRPFSPSCPPQCLYLPLFSLIGLPPPLSRALHRSPHPSYPRLSSSPPPVPCPAPLRGRGFSPPSQTMLWLRVPSFPACEAPAASASSGRGWGGEDEGAPLTPFALPCPKGLESCPSPSARPAL